jgi:SNF family Na+-dependent transporter
VLFAAFTSLVSILEIPISYMIDEWCFSRTKAVLIQAGLVSFFAIFAAMSFGMSPFLTDFIPYGGGQRSFFDLLADTFSEVILPFVGFLACIVVSLPLAQWRAVCRTGDRGRPVHRFADRALCELLSAHLHPSGAAVCFPELGCAEVLRV